MSESRGVSAEKVFSSVRWVAIGQILGQIARLGVSIVLARLLTPEDFGLMTMAGTFTVLGSLFASLGAGPVIVQRPQLNEKLLRSLATLSLAVGFGLSALFAAASGPIARFYEDPRVAGVVAALGLSFALSSLGFVADGLLQRDLKFRALVVVDLVVLVVNAALSIGLALAGMRVWSLVIANLAGTALRSGLLLVMSTWPLRLGFDRREVRGVLGFSASVMGFGLTQYFSRNADNLIIGRVLGAIPLGYYDYAYRFYMYPLEAVTGVLIRVMFPAFARLQDDLGALGRAFLRANGSIALVTFPMMTGLAAVAGPFVHVVLGEQWITVIPLLQILAPVGMLNAIAATTGQIFLARGRASLRMWWGVIYTAVMVASFLVGVRWGIMGVATAYAIVAVPVFFIAFWLALRLVGLRLGSLWPTLRPMVLACLAMAAAVTAARIALELAGAAPVVVLMACVPLGAAIYVVVIRILGPKAVADLYRLLPGAARSNKFVRWSFGAAASGQWSGDSESPE